MRKLIVLCAFVATALLVAAPLTATAAPGDKCVKGPRGTLKCSFDGDKVEAGLITHDGKFIGHKIPPKFDSLIDYRVSFSTEFDKLVEEL